MERTKLLTIAVISLLVINIATLGFLMMHKPERPGHPEHGPRGEGPKMIIIERLHFDEQQQKRYQLLIDDHRSKTDAFHKATREMHDQLYSLLKAEPVNKVMADSIMQKIGDDQKAMDNVNFDHFQQIKALCKPEQVAGFNKLVDELGELFSHKGPPPH